MSILPEDDCRGPFYTPPSECQEASRTCTSDTCEVLGEPDCFAGTGGTIPCTAPCALTEFDTGPNATRCAGQSGPGSHPGGTTYQPYFCVSYVDDARDGDGSNAAFFGREAMIDFLTASLTIAIDPCAPESYCGGGGQDIWMNRMFLEDANGWEMICNKVEKCASPLCEQHVVKQLTVAGSEIGISILTLATDYVPYCFGFTTHHYCLIKNCAIGQDNELINCVGSTFSVRVDAVDRLFVDLSCRYGNVTPFADTSTTELMNAMWETLDSILDQLDAPGHSPTNHYDSPSVRQWHHAEEFGAAQIVNVDVGGTINGQTFQILMGEEVIAEYIDTTESVEDVIAGLVANWNASSNPDAANITATGFYEYLQLVHDITGETFEISLNIPGGGAVFFQTDIQEGTPDPAVQGTASYYSNYNGVDIPITLQGSCSGSVYTTQATLRLQSVIVVVDLMAEHLRAEANMRISGSVSIELRVRVQRDSEAAGKFDWLNPDNRYDLRLEDPNDPGNEHPRERILATGPNGERVWRQNDDGAVGYLHTWEGLKGPQTHSKGPNTFDEYCSGASSPCCGFLRTLNGLVIHGKTNDNTGLEDRFKIIRCTVGGSLDGETFQIKLAGAETQVVAEHTDTSGVIADTVATLVALFNSSAESYTANITASIEGDAVKLTPNNFNVPMYDVILDITEGDATFTSETDYFDELPQYYEGSISFGTADDPDTIGCGCT